MATWRCVKNCGACCHLDPNDRPDLEEYLEQQELELYLGMVGADGWCVNFDRLTRGCKIYDDRPRFCRVILDNFQKMFTIDPSEFHEFAIDCCRQQIEGVYGADSEEMERFDTEIEEVNSQ
jgi:hypothetical protein